MNRLRYVAHILFVVMVTKVSCSVGADDCDGLSDIFIPVAATIKSVRSTEQVTALPSVTGGSTWQQLDRQCAQTHRGYNLLQQAYTSLTYADKIMCDDDIVPLGIKAVKNRLVWWNQRVSNSKKELVKASDLQRAPINATFSTGVRVAALNLTSTTWRLVDEAHPFRCALCQRSSLPNINTLVYPAPPVYFNTDGSRVFGVTLAAGLKTTDQESDDRLQLLSAAVAHEFNQTSDNVYVVRNRSKLFYHVVAASDVVTTRLVGRDLVGYNMTSVDLVDECSAENTTYGYGSNKTIIKWPKTGVDAISEIYVIDSATLFATRECAYNASALRAAWTAAVPWNNPWQRCQIAAENSDRANFRQWLRNRTELPLEPTQLTDVFRKLDNYFFYLDDTSPPKEYQYTFSILNDLEKILLNLVKSPDFLVSLMGDSLGLFVSEPTQNPVKGLQFKRASVEDVLSDGSQIEPITSNTTINDLTYQSAEITIVFSETFRHSRLSFSLVKYVDDTFPAGWSGRKRSTGKDVVVQFVIPQTNMSANTYVDIFLDGGRPLVWLDAKDDWLTSCDRIKSVTEVRDAYRCQLTNTNGAVFRGMFYVSYAHDNLGEFLRRNVTLLVVMIFELIICVFGLASIGLTAIVNKRWREDVGHQILLHMSTSLAFNLALGFANNFIDVDKKGVPCICVGVARHYSYLAMFVWMFLLSGLQLKRFLTMIGSRTIPYLLLKVACIAWGLPLLPIVVLLSWDPRFYTTDHRERGFCYPEETAFKVTIQLPAAFILVSNGIMFLVILFHLYNPWGSIAELRRHGLTNEEIQSRKLKTTLFIFFLFGLTWSFHFLAEEGIIDNQIIFEYLFLITATTHIFMLSLFFIFFDKTTRNEWKAKIAKWKVGNLCRRNVCSWISCCFCYECDGKVGKKYELDRSAKPNQSTDNISFQTTSNL